MKASLALCDLIASQALALLPIQVIKNPAACMYFYILSSVPSLDHKIYSHSLVDFGSGGSKDACHTSTDTGTFTFMVVL